MVGRDLTAGFSLGFAVTISMICIYHLPDWLSAYKLSDLSIKPGDHTHDTNVPESSLRNDDDHSLATKMSKEVRILVWVMTAPKNLETKAKYVKRTWGPRANVILYMSSETNETFPTIGLNVTEGRKHLLSKTHHAFRYVYKHHFNDADWFMKADDDTYVIMENLRYFLSDKNTEDPIHYGHMFINYIVEQGYYSGGAGYVLSKEALRRLATNGSNPRVCRQDRGGEDYMLGRCMQTLGVKTASPNDIYGRSRFHFEKPDTFLASDYPKWYRQRDINGGRGGLDSMSDNAISYHYVSGTRMLLMDFFIYHLRPYGVRFGSRELNPPRETKKYIK